MVLSHQTGVRIPVALPKASSSPPRRSWRGGSFFAPAPGLAAAAFVALVLAGTSRPLPAAERQTEKQPVRVVVKAARLIDGKSRTPLAPAVVVIEDDRIVQVGSGIKPPAGAQVIDLGGATLLPGLIDCHDHLTANP